ncbi:putative transcriptional regulator [Phaeobacter piscinae]|uniref:Transcriptional regulator n=1 Tax=Phaeobacter piscinae TaxID=1580596 RepID=A0AAN1LAW7_9RHOB|nr:MarR family winged helix-turn-helix transcriptional regulator [Phaeobacter piscinae]ATG43844.1 putative transcriptional regulator [Phaeobacter piscinae]AUQ74003.1 putative transcriptional regulator [Phaeobacter piscinae]AUR36154.1 putative transcriptional regulator [Phaeobacter piscinae]
MDVKVTLEHFLQLAHRRCQRAWAELSADLRLSHNEFEYLRAIRDQEDKTTDKDNHGQHLQDVVNDLGVRKSSASAMVLKLEDRGLVARFPCRYDARAQHIILTEAGKALLASGESVYESVARELASELPADIAGAFERGR